MLLYFIRTLDGQFLSSIPSWKTFIYLEGHLPSARFLVSLKIDDIYLEGHFHFHLLTLLRDNMQLSSRTLHRTQIRLNWFDSKRPALIYSILYTLTTLVLNWLLPRERSGIISAHLGEGGQVKGLILPTLGGECERGYQPKYSWCWHWEREWVLKGLPELILNNQGLGFVKPVLFS